MIDKSARETFRPVLIDRCTRSLIVTVYEVVNIL